MKYVTLYGGFHNVSSVRVRIPEDSYSKLVSGNASLEDVLTDGQKMRLDRHFCGIRGCTCKKWRSAEIEY